MLSAGSTPAHYACPAGDPHHMRHKQQGNANTLSVHTCCQPLPPPHQGLSLIHNVPTPCRTRPLMPSCSTAAVPPLPWNSGRPAAATASESPAPVAAQPAVVPAVGSADPQLLFLMLLFQLLCSRLSASGALISYYWSLDLAKIQGFTLVQVPGKT
jgi:hypothetical protein